MKHGNLIFGVLLGLIPIIAENETREKFGLPHRVEGMALSPDGTTLVVSITSFRNVPAPVPEISDTRHWKRLYQLDDWTYRDIPVTEGPMVDTAMLHDEVASDGRRFIASMNDGTIRVVDPGVGEGERSVPAHERRVRTLALSRDGTLLASSGIEGTVAVWKVDGMELRNRFDLSGEEIGMVAFSPDDSLVAVATDMPDFDITLWSLATGTMTHRLKGHTGHVSLAFTPASDRLITGGGSMGMLDQSPDGTLRVWNVATGAEEKVIYLGGKPRRGLPIVSGSALLAWVFFWGPAVRRKQIARPARTFLVALVAFPVWVMLVFAVTIIVMFLKWM